MRARALLPVLLAASCGQGTVTETPRVVSVSVVYESRLPPGCPDGGNVCYPSCAHGNAPAGLQTLVPLWGAPSVRLTETAPGRYEGVLPDVPVGAPLRVVVRDIGACCVDACAYPPVLQDVFVNGTQLTRVVSDGLPEGIPAALEFSVTASGAVLD
jgi:hypothetical protein